jgi:hypothetical protein
MLGTSFSSKTDMISLESSKLDDSELIIYILLSLTAVAIFTQG